MGEIPGWALTHRMIVEPYLGMTGTGPSYGEPVEVRCHIEDDHRTRPSAGGRDTGDEGTAWCQLRHADIVTPEARVRIYDRAVEIRRVRRREYGAAASPNHLEIKFT